MKLHFMLIACMVVFAVNHSAIGQSKNEIRIARQVDSIFHSMIRAAEKLDFDKLSTGVDDRHKAGFVSGGAYYENFDSLLAVVRAGAGGVSKQIITIEKQKTSVLSNSLVLLTAHGKAQTELTDGRSFSATFDWSFVYERIDNQWKVIHSHQSVVR